MCGRYTLTVNNKPDLSALAATAGYDPADRFNIAPQQRVLVLTEGRTPTTLRWDFSPAWARKPMHLSNARSETLREKPSFRGVSRCVFLADGWYEWLREPGQKTPWYHHIPDQTLYFAGIYNHTSGCAIVTRAAHDNIAHVHHRQPVLLEPRAVDNWLLGHDLFASAITRDVTCHPVSRAVNNATHDGPHLISPVAGETQPPVDPVPPGTSGDLFS